MCLFLKITAVLQHYIFLQKFLKSLDAHVLPDKFNTWSFNGITDGAMKKLRRGEYSESFKEVADFCLKNIKEDIRKEQERQKEKKKKVPQ